MATSSNSSHKDEVLRLVDENDQASSALQSQGQNIVEFATYSRDLGQRVGNVVREMPDDSSLSTQGWSQLGNAMRAARDQARWTLGTLQGSTFSGTVVSSALTTSVTLTISEVFGKNTPANVELRAFLAHPALFQKALDALAAFGLNVAPTGSRSPTELLNEAHAALSAPSGTATSPASVLLPARGSVTQVLGMLLLRRRQQEPASGASRQIASISSQCAATAYGAEYFAILARDWEALNDRLSGGKVAAMKREDIQVAFEDVLRFHVAFLEGLDQSKMR